METRYGITDFSGGLNTNPQIAANELQEATNIDLEEFGVVRPAKADTLIKSVSNVTCIQVLGGYIYYLVSTTLYRCRTDGSGEITLGTIGSGRFYALKWGDIVIIVASDKCYKVIGSSLYGLGVTSPSVGPTLALSTQLSKQIETFEDATGWTATGATLTDNATDYKQGSNSMKIAPTAANTIGYATKANSIDLTVYSDGTVSGDNDLISFWLYINDIEKYSYALILFDINTGDFKNDFYRKIIPLMPGAYDSTFNEDYPESSDDYTKVNLDDSIIRFENAFDPADFEEFSVNYVVGDATMGRIKSIIKASTKKAIDHSGTWSNIKIKKSEFVRHGRASGKGWDTVAAVKVAVMASATGLEVSIDDLKLIGGGSLDHDKFKVSYSYLARFTLDDGSTYEEESALSPETEIENAERQNIQVTAVADSSDSQVTHKRIYIRGGGLELRHRAGEIGTTDTTFTIDKEELDLVVLPTENCRKNGIPPTSPTHGILMDGRLFLAKDKKLYWSQSLQPAIFYSTDTATFPYGIKAIMEKGADLACLMQTMEVLYRNPGYGPSDGGFLHYADSPHGCIATPSAIKGFYAADEGMAFYSGNEPQIITDKIRSELLALVGRTNTIGAYLRGVYYFCIPDGGSVMYSFKKSTGRFIKHSGITYVAAGDDGDLYVVKTSGIYTFQTSSAQRKSYAIRTPELIQPDDTQYRHIVVDADIGTDTTTVEYYLNDSAESSLTKTTSNRERLLIPISQKAGSRVSVRLSTSSAITNMNYGIYGVWLQ